MAWFFPTSWLSGTAGFSNWGAVRLYGYFGCRAGHRNRAPTIAMRRTAQRSGQLVRTPIRWGCQSTLLAEDLACWRPDIDGDALRAGG